ncbi:MAG: hypothetical protein KY451_06665 [Actinobacteria bacterium]|nr:hypothetical protein [Actinomycetota bacterium]
MAGSLRSPGSPSAAELTAIVTGGLACTAVVVPCMRGARDAVRTTPC